MDVSALTLDNIRHLPLWFTGTIVGVFAGLLGSFINVCIYRIPLGQSIVMPRSRCTSCGHALGVPDLIPILSWVVLRGRCRHCGAAVAARYTLVELAVVAVWLGAFVGLGPTAAFLGTAVGCSVLFTVVGVVLYGRSLRSADKSGLTFLEILFTAIILAAVVGPFLNSNVSSRAAAVRNRERIIAYSLAREKLEELRCIPVRKLRDDWELYRGKASGTAENIFRDEFFGHWAKMDEDKEQFWSTMSDILTATGRCGREDTMPEPVFEKFKRNFKEYYGYDYEPYPDGYRAYRRSTRVDDLTDPANPGNILKRVTVTVSITSQVHNNYRITLASYFSDN